MKTEYDDSDVNPIGLSAAINRNEDYPAGSLNLSCSSSKLSCNDGIPSMNVNFNFQRRLDQLQANRSAPHHSTFIDQTSRSDKRKGSHLTPPQRPVRGPIRRPSWTGKSLPDVSPIASGRNLESPNLFGR